MDNDIDDYSKAIENVTIERERKPFEINQLKLEHFHWNSGDIYIGMPITTSLELTCKYNYEEDKLEWKKTISHTYLSIEPGEEYTTDSYEEKLDNSAELIKEIQNYDLRDLKNNYYTEEDTEKFTHWELTYNNYFKITGTYDQVITEFKIISELLQFKTIIEKEVNKIKVKIGKE